MNQPFFCRLSGWGRLLAALLLTTVIASAQPRRLPPNMQNPDQLNPGEGERVLEAFRYSAPAGDLVADFRLTHQPFRAREVVHEGRFQGTWASGPRSRVELPATAERPTQRWLLWNGPTPASWNWNEETGITVLDEEALFAPLLPGLTITPFDLQMPFIYWRDHAYEGTRRVKGRPAHYFLLYPPEDNARYATLGAVRVVIDADFNALLSSDWLDPDGEVIKSFRVQSFKKVNDQWIVRRIDLIDRVTRDRTRFELIAAAVGLALDPVGFRPDTLPADVTFEGALDRL